MSNRWWARDLRSALTTQKTRTTNHNEDRNNQSQSQDKWPPRFTTIENVTLKKWFLSKYAKDHLLRLVLEKKAPDDLSNPTDEFKYFAKEILRKQEVVSDFFWRKQPSSAPWYLFIPTKPTQTGRPEYGAGITNIGSLENEVIRLCLAALSLFRLWAGFWKLTFQIRQILIHIAHLWELRTSSQKKQRDNWDKLVFPEKSLFSRVMILFVSITVNNLWIKAPMMGGRGWGFFLLLLAVNQTSLSSPSAVWVNRAHFG